jgi:hypothetical protein
MTFCFVFVCLCILCLCLVSCFHRLAAGCSQGIFSTWAGLLVEILEDPLDKTSSAGSWVGFAANVSAVVGLSLFPYNLVYSPFSQCQLC